MKLIAVDSRQSAALLQNNELPPHATPLKIATGALQTATVKSAALLQMDDRTGRIEEGFEADLILVPGNPLTNIEALQDVLLVMSDDRLALKRMPFGVTD
jgi:cytosine/adenosine deaminase-related metal-dependent hydrolase